MTVYKSMLLGRIRGAALASVLAAALVPPLAHADIYTWIDGSGATNVSNLPPPEGAKVTKVQKALPPEILAREDAAREAALQAETQALNDRVRQLEAAAAAPARFVAPPSPPIIQYIVAPQQPPMQQIVEMTQPSYGNYGYGGCDPSWAGCALSWFPGVYPASVFVVGVPSRPTHPIRHPPPKMTTPRLPPPFGAPVIPNVGTVLPHNVVMRQPVQTVPLSLGLKRG